MSALYEMRYTGQTGAFGIGVLYIGNGKIAGGDAGGGRYHGTYVTQAGRMKGAVVLEFPTGGNLVTGQPMPPNSKLQLTADWPTNFDNGQPQQIMVDGRPVSVTFNKIADIP